MRNLVRLIVLIVFAGAFYAIGRLQYPGTAVTVASGRSFDVREPERECHDGVCMLKVMFYTATTDLETLHGEAEDVARWARAAAVQQGANGVLVLAINPGMLRLLPPKSGRAFAWAWRTPGEWAYVGDDDLSGALVRGPRS